MDADDVAVRRARVEDHDDVVAMTENTWPHREGGDYLGEVFPEWVEGDGDGQRTLAAERDGDVVGVVQAVRLSPHEAWYQGMRVHPDHRGEGVSRALNDACFEWSRSWGATVGRLMVFSWNVQGLGAAYANGFRAETEFRWLHPEPDAGATATATVTRDPDAAYACWARSDARDHLRGLALDREESWAVSELTREDFRAVAEETAVLAVTRAGDPGNGGAVSGASGISSGRRPDGGTVATTYRVRDYERDGERIAEYGVAAWDDPDALRDLAAAVARDAADLGADRTRVLVPETPRHVTEAAGVGIGVSDDPDFVLGADLTGSG